MKIVFMGTSEFAVPALKSISNSDHEVLAVFTKPPSKSKRGQKLQKSPVHEAAENLGLEIFYPTSLKDKDTLSTMSKISADIIIVAAYGHILRPTILTMYQYGCLNIHPSPLPRWRGAAPIERTIYHGDKKTALCIIQMNEGLDTGDILLSEEVNLTGKETGASLTATMGELGGKMIVEAIDNYSHLIPRKQNKNGDTYAEKLSKEEALINWSKTSVEIERMIRAFYPWPGCYFNYNNETIKILSAETLTLEHKHKPGTVINNNLHIACGTGILKPIILQKAGKKSVTAKDFLNGNTIPIGTILT